jgi:poly-gamma-glutamate capsule biosynthesis protein CapA/YwtB (metallophosphatase superfamily)
MVAVVIVLIAALAVVARATIFSDDDGKPDAAATTPAGAETTGPGSTTGTRSTTPATTGPATTGPTTEPSPSPAEPKQALVIHGAGDTNVDPGYIGVSPSNYDVLLSGMDGLFKRDDLTVVNLECAVSDLGSPVPKEFNFQGDPDALPYLERDGVDVASMANNHAYDYGPEALVDTRKNIEDAGMVAVGGGKDPAEATKAGIVHVKGWTIAIVGFDKVVDPFPEAIAAPGHPGTACGHDVDCMVAATRKAAAMSDLTIVNIHWGVELDTQPRADDVEIAHRLIDAGADIIFGGHAHRLQPYDMIDGRPVFYSLGNFVWPRLSAESATTEVAEVHVSPKGKFTASVLPTIIESGGHPVLQ